MKRVFVVLTALLIAAAAAVFFNVNTWEHLQEQRAKKSQSDARMQAAEEERARLLEEKADLESPRGREAQARREGYIKPGEEPLRTAD